MNCLKFSLFKKVAMFLALANLSNLNTTNAADASIFFEEGAPSSAASSSFSYVPPQEGVVNKTATAEDIEEAIEASAQVLTSQKQSLDCLLSQEKPHTNLVNAAKRKIAETEAEIGKLQQLLTEVANGKQVYFSGNLRGKAETPEELANRLETQEKAREQLSFFGNLRRGLREFINSNPGQSRQEDRRLRNVGIAARQAEQIAFGDIKDLPQLSWGAPYLEQLQRQNGSNESALQSIAEEPAPEETPEPNKGAKILAEISSDSSSSSGKSSPQQSAAAATGLSEGTDGLEGSGAEKSNDLDAQIAELKATIAANRDFINRSSGDTRALERENRQRIFELRDLEKQKAQKEALNG